MKTEVVIVVSDIHCGSDVGLAPPETKTKNGNVIGFGDNLHQAWLWEKWLSGIAQIKQILGNSKAALFVNGDATEGCHHHNNADLIAATIITHTEMAAECLKPISKLCNKTFVVKGTECHTEHMEDVLAEKLKAVGRQARNKWLVEINGVLLDVAHHMTTTSRSYLEASAMSILMGNARNNAIRSGHRAAEVYLRAHRHCGGTFTDNAGLFGVTGGWQFLTRHGFKVATDSIPRPSFLLLDFRGKKSGQLPTPISITFNPPQDEIYQA